ncbi:hypothetical protein [Rathayibacter sp. AY1F9]|uniref:hypothetical protein n=1 Tax=Rathayibacter sp. AY1F9 TaxID=2080563 RepID=UPI001CA50BC5|nr:hypothetical protein [Rathayibacter sp. AY1F9]
MAAEHHAAAVHPEERGSGTAEDARPIAAGPDGSGSGDGDLDVVDHDVGRGLASLGGASRGEAQQSRAEDDRREEAAEREVGVEEGRRRGGAG